MLKFFTKRGAKKEKAEKEDEHAVSQESKVDETQLLQFGEDMAVEPSEKEARQGKDEKTPVKLIVIRSAAPPNSLEKPSIAELVEQGKIESIKHFLQKKGYENITNFVHTEVYGHFRDSLLHIAVQHKQAHIVQLFRRYGVSLKLFNDDNETPLHYAALFYDKETFKELLRFPKAMKLLDMENKKGLTPSGMANSWENKEFFDVIRLRYREILDENYERERRTGKIDEDSYYRCYGKKLLSF